MGLFKDGGFNGAKTDVLKGHFEGPRSNFKVELNNFG